MEDNQLLSVEDIRFHLSALKKLAMADGDYADSEKRFIEQVAQTYKASFPDLDIEALQEREFSDEEYAQGLDSLKQNMLRAKLFLKDLISLGYVDGDYSKPERKLVREIAAKINVTDESVDLLEKAVDSIIKASVLMNNALYN